LENFGCFLRRVQSSTAGQPISQLVQADAISDLVSFLEVLFFNEVLLVSDQPNRLHLMFLVPGHNDLVETDMRAYFGEVVNFRIADGCSE